jgi:hypothetical protein
MHAACCPATWLLSARCVLRPCTQAKRADLSPVIRFPDPKVSICFFFTNFARCILPPFWYRLAYAFDCVDFLCVVGNRWWIDLFRSSSKKDFIHLIVFHDLFNLTSVLHVQV